MPVTVFQGAFKRGELIANRYRIIRKLGEGGAGSVYHCRDQRSDSEVAVKVLDNPSDASRFKREARVMKGVQDQHVLRMLASGNHQGNLPYMVLEFMRGGSLRDYLDKKKRLSAEESAWIVMMAIRGLRGVRTVHRDLKPENLLIHNPGGGRAVHFEPGNDETASIIKVADFGLAKPVTGSNETSLTRSAAVMGTPCYMSPEQCRSTKRVSFKTDIYALGCILVELGSGTPPYDANNVYDIMAMHCNKDCPPQLGRMPKVLHPIAKRCLHIAPGQRYRSLKALEDDLAQVAGVRSESSGGWGCMLVIVVLLLAAAVAGWWWWEELNTLLRGWLSPQG